jgi:hypothetical protein
VKGGAGRSTPGFCSTDVTGPRHVGAKRIDQCSRRLLVEQPRTRVFQLARRRIEILAAGDPLIANPDERGDEFAPLTLQLASRSQ